VVLDASVLIAFVDPGDPHHEPAVEALTRRASEDFVLPASAYAESMVGPHRHSSRAVARLDRVLDDLPVHIEPLTRRIARLAAALRASHRSLKLPDALVIATGESLQAAEILTADRAWTKASKRAISI